MLFLKRNKAGLILACLAALFALSACGRPGGPGGRPPGKDPQPIGDQVYPMTEADMKTAPEDPEEIDLSLCAEPLWIREGGDHLLYGTLYHPLFIEAEDKLVHLFLDGAEIRSGSGPAINVMSAGKVIITLVEGSENTIRDSQNYHNYDIYEAAISAPCDLTINGTGSLFVYGFYKDAVKSKDILKLNGGTYFVQAKRDGLRGSDGLVLAPEKLTVETERNGLATTKLHSMGKGDMDIREGDIMVTSGKYAVSCTGDVYLRATDFKCISVYGDMNVEGRTIDLREGAPADAREDSGSPS